MRKILPFLGICAALAALTYIYWPEIPIGENLTEKDIAKADRYLREYKTTDALMIVQKNRNQLIAPTPAAKKWRDNLIKTAEERRDIISLLVFYEYFPQSFEHNEKASLQVAEALIQTKNFEDYSKLRQQWKNHERRKGSWLMLDADHLIVEQKPQDAIQVLKGFTFQDNISETKRLVKIAELTMPKSLLKSWDYLELAHDKDPRNPFVDSYRGKIFEISGKNTLALGEYISAIQTDPKNSNLRDQLADFYQRHREYSLALEIWSESLLPPKEDTVWLKTYFWNRVVKPISFDWHEYNAPEGPYKPLIDYMISLKPNQFWDDDAFDKIPQGEVYLDQSQVTFWLRLLQNLKDGKEEEALTLLKSNPFKNESWDEPLETALTEILTVRQQINADNHNPSRIGLLKRVSFAPRHVLFQELSHSSMPKDFEELFLSQEAFSATLLAAGWLEAGLELHVLPVIPRSFPDWVAIDITQAMRSLKGNSIALQFAELQPHTPKMTLMSGELLATDKPNEALEKLKTVANENSDVGSRASWLMAIIYLEQGKLDEAKDAIKAQPRLSQDILGQETLAKIEMKEGNFKEAEEIYSNIQESSLEAKSYFAHQAFRQHDLKKARRLTEELLVKYPANPVLRKNYMKILELDKDSVTHDEENTPSSEEISEIQSEDISKKIQIPTEEQDSGIGAQPTSENLEISDVQELSDHSEEKIKPTDEDKHTQESSTNLPERSENIEPTQHHEEEIKSSNEFEHVQESSNITHERSENINPSEDHDLKTNVDVKQTQDLNEQEINSHEPTHAAPRTESESIETKEHHEEKINAHENVQPITEPSHINQEHSEHHEQEAQPRNEEEHVNEQTSINNGCENNEESTINAYPEDQETSLERSEYQEECQDSKINDAGSIIQPQAIDQCQPNHSQNRIESNASQSTQNNENSFTLSQNMSEQNSLKSNNQLGNNPKPSDLLRSILKKSGRIKTKVSSASNKG